MSAARSLIIGLAFVPVLFVAAAMAAPSPGPDAHVTKEKSCRSPFKPKRIPQGIKATGIRCATAVKVAFAAGDKTPSGCVKFLDSENHLAFARPCVRHGYRCTARTSVQGLVLNTTCKRGGKTIRFQY
ncbi:hypothetical protein [Baekduia sp. Peel2402]|uniref:hypothetical protein n=1 Tax=Baekduia sp. Peel2402 TaxID=3458296 RepID=UPI00403EE0E5